MRAQIQNSRGEVIQRRMRRGDPSCLRGKDRLLQPRSALTSVIQISSTPSASSPDSHAPADIHTHAPPLQWPSALPQCDHHAPGGGPSKQETKEEQ